MKCCSARDVLTIWRAAARIPCPSSGDGGGTTTRTCPSSRTERVDSANALKDLDRCERKISFSSGEKPRNDLSAAVVPRIRIAPAGEGAPRRERSEAHT